MSDDDVFQVAITTSSDDEARRIVDAALERRLAACGQVMGPVTSRYWWNGTLETGTELLCLFKTSGRALSQLVALIEAEHSYDTPEVTVTPIVGGSSRYLDWVRAESTPPRG